MKKSLTYFAALIILVSCEEGYVLDAEQTPPKIVIEGLVTDQPQYQSVRVTMSAGFYDSGETPRVTNATVSVADDLGEVYEFVHNPRGHADSMGIYIPVSPFAGQLGRTYFLTVNANGSSYQASDQLFSVIPLPVISLESLSEQNLKRDSG